MNIDWEQLAQQIDFPSDPGVGRDGERARRALVMLLGERTVLDTLDFALSNQSGQGLARFVLQALEPWVAQQRCFEIFQTARVRRRRLNALVVLGDMVNRRSLPWIADFLEDRDPKVRVFAARLVETLARRALVNEADVASHLARIESHPDQAVREIGPRIRSELDFWGGEVQVPEGSGATLAEAISPGGAIVDQAVDWGALARSLGTVHARGEGVSLEDALFAIETILGEELMKAAVDDYVALRPGRGLARAILLFLGSKAAVWRCQEICRAGESLEARAEALELLCLIAGVRVIPWIEEFLDVPEPRLQEIMARHLTYLAQENHLNDTARRLLPRLERHPNPVVREAGDAFREYFQRVEQGEGD